MARTFPTSRNTSGTTFTVWAGLSPLDGYVPDVASERPVQYLESGSTAITAITAAPTFYCKQTITAGMCGRLSAAAADFQTHIAGANVDNIYGIASWVQIDGGSTIDGGADGGVITPLSVGVREKVTSTHTSSQVVFGIQAQCLFDHDLPTAAYFARCNVGGSAAMEAQGVASIFFSNNRPSLGVVEAAQKDSAFGYCKFITAQGQLLYVNLWT